MALTLPPDPTQVLAASRHWAVLLNADQTLLGRCFLLLLRPETDVAALTGDEVADLWALTRRVRAALDALWSPDHYNYAFLMNVDPQVHFHLIPRYQSPRVFAGATFTDPAFGGHYALGPERPLDADTAEALRARLRETTATTQ